MLFGLLLQKAFLKMRIVEARIIIYYAQINVPLIVGETTYF